MHSHDTRCYMLSCGHGSIVGPFVASACCQLSLAADINNGIGTNNTKLTTD